MLLKLDRLVQESCFLPDHAEVAPSLSTAAYLLRKLLRYLQPTLFLSLALWTAKHHERAACFVRPCEFHYRWDAGLRFSTLSFQASSSACCCLTKCNPSEVPESKPFIFTPTGRPALYFVSSGKRGEFDFNFNLGLSLSFRTGLAGVPACWFRLHPGNLRPHLVTGWGIWQRCIQKGPGAEVAPVNSEKHTHKKHEFLHSAVGKLLCLSEGHKELLVFEVFAQKPVESGSSSCSTSDYSRSITGFSLSASAAQSEKKSSNCWSEKVFPVRLKLKLTS